MSIDEIMELKSLGVTNDEIKEYISAQAGANNDSPIDEPKEPKEPKEIDLMEVDVENLVKTVGELKNIIGEMQKSNIDKATGGKTLADPIKEKMDSFINSL